MERKRFERIALRASSARLGLISHQPVQNIEASKNSTCLLNLHCIHVNKEPIHPFATESPIPYSLSSDS
jgi:hypothetical protein